MNRWRRPSQKSHFYIFWHKHTLDIASTITSATAKLYSWSQRWNLNRKVLLCQVNSRYYRTESIHTKVKTHKHVRYVLLPRLAVAFRWR